MPIRVSELQEAKKPLKERVYEWLARRPNEAFKLEEVISGLTNSDAAMIGLVLALASTKTGGASTEKMYDAYRPYVQALDALRVEGRVESGELRGSSYFYAKEKKP
jgi:hypothetical protein